MISGTNIGISARRMPSALLGMIALVFVFERFVSTQSLNFTETSAMSWAYSETLARSGAHGAEILCFGSSLSKLGLLPRIIQQRTGRKALNLSVLSGHMPSSYFLFKHSLEAGARPVAVVIDCQDGPVWPGQEQEQFEGLRSNRRYWPEILSSSESLDLALTARDVTFFAEVMLAHILASYRSRFEIRNRIVADLTGARDEMSFVSRAQRRNWTANLGANLISACDAPSATEEGPAVPRGQEYQGPTLRNALTEAYTRRFIELAAKRRIPVFWVLPPLSVRHEARRTIVGVDQYLETLARTARMIYSRLIVIDGRRAGYPNDAFSDAVHLNAKGAAAFTNGISEVLEQALPNVDLASRWNPLFTYSSSTSEVPEDFETTDRSIAIELQQLQRVRR